MITRVLGCVTLLVVTTSSSSSLWAWAFTATTTTTPLSSGQRPAVGSRRETAANTQSATTSLAASSASDGPAWTGNVVSNTADGSIQGCRIQASESSSTEWTVTIDGVEADLGRFGDAIYRKIIGDAKRERFQGFRPGTIPPHLQATYKLFAMDECARETVLEALQQNNIRPFEAARSEMHLENFVIPPAAAAKKKKKRKKAKKKKGSKGLGVAEEAVDMAKDEPQPQVPQWRTFATMKEAVDAGWKPGQSFSFVATNVKGQKVLGKEETSGATPLGLNY